MTEVLTGRQIGDIILEKSMRRLRAWDTSHAGVMRELTAICRTTESRLDAKAKWWDGVTRRIQSHNKAHQAT